VADYKPRWFTRPQTVTHPTTNRARCRKKLVCFSDCRIYLFSSLAARVFNKLTRYSLE